MEEQAKKISNFLQNKGYEVAYRINEENTKAKFSVRGPKEKDFHQGLITKKQIVMCQLYGGSPIKDLAESLVEG